MTAAQVLLLLALVLFVAAAFAPIGSARVNAYRVHLVAAGLACVAGALLLGTGFAG